MHALDGKVAVISGGTSGIGARAAELFVNEGARVIIAVRRRERGEELAAKLGAAARFIRTDVSIEHDVEAIIKDAVDCFGQSGGAWPAMSDAVRGRTCTQFRNRREPPNCEFSATFETVRGREGSLCRRARARPIVPSREPARQPMWLRARELM